MKRFQITLFHTRTDTIDIVADSLVDVQTIMSTLSNADVRTIKELEYINPTPNPVFSQFYRELKILACNSKKNVNKFFTIRFMRPMISKDFIISKTKQYLQVDGNAIDHVCNIIKHQ